MGIIEPPAGEGRGRVPQVEVIVYRDDDGSAPLVDWLAGLPDEARDRCLARLQLLEQHGHDLRRPHCENLGDGIYELRVKFYRVNYRMLYFFHGREAVVVTHGFSKEAKVPPKQITAAAERRKKFEQDPEAHTFREEE
jgi:phage-related protein